MENKLNTIKIGFGESKTSPILLTDAQLETLLKVINDDDIEEKSFSGFVKTEHPIKGSQSYLLGINGITYVGSIMADAYEVYADESTIKEGNNLEIHVVGIDSNLLNFEVVGIDVTKGDVTYNDIKSKISFSNNIMKIGKTNNYSGWEATVYIRVKPKYESPEAQNLEIKVLGRTKPTAIAITGPSSLAFGSTSFTVEKVPSDTDMNIVSIDVTYEKVLVLESTVSINQSGTVSSPELMITGDIGKNGTADDNAFAWVKANTHGYVGTYDGNVMKLKQLDDANHTLYADGTSAVTDIITKDTFIKLPKFWYNAEEVGNNFNITFATYAKPGFIEWDDTQLIGKYEATVQSNIVKSIASDAEATPSVSWQTFFANTRAMSNDANHFRMVTMEAHSIIQLLFYGYYGNTNAQAVCGTGDSNSNRKVGLTSSKGMTDTTPSTSAVSTCFCGLENWWGDKYEWIDNIMTSDSSRNCKIFDYSKTQYFASTVEKVALNIPLNSECISKLSFKNGVVYPNTRNGSDYNKYYSDYGGVIAASGYVGRRSGNGYYAYGGVACLNVSGSVSDAGANFGSRLFYHGDIEII